MRSGLLRFFFGKVYGKVYGILWRQKSALQRFFPFHSVFLKNEIFSSAHPSVLAKVVKAVEQCFEKRYVCKTNCNSLHTPIDKIRGRMYTAVDGCHTIGNGGTPVIYLTEAERRIMEILWEKSSRTFDEITREVSSENHWTIHAIQILLKRLIQKEAVREDKVLGLPVYSSGKSIQETAVISPEKAWSGFFAMKRPC